MSTDKLPIYPNFTVLGPKHQQIINDLFTSQEVYSDFNFISLWSWDHQNQLQLSSLNDNIVVKFQDYIDQNLYFYSFFGGNMIDETIKTLLSTKSVGILDELRLIPEFIVGKIEARTDFIIEEDRDSFDYIIGVENATKLEGKANDSKRRNLNKFLKQNEGKFLVKELDIKHPNTAMEVMNLFDLWSKSVKSNPEEQEAEKKALTKLFQEHHTIASDKLHIVGIYMNDTLHAFSANEIVGNKSAVGHYKKTSRDYDGIGAALDNFTFNSLLQKGISTINIEQDLGIEGLRKSKESYHPIKFLKKYTIRLRD